MDCDPVPSWCSECQMSFKLPDEYQRHQKEVHVRLPPEPIRKHGQQVSVSEGLLSNEKRLTGAVEQKPLCLPAASQTMPQTAPANDKAAESVDYESNVPVDMDLEDEDEKEEQSAATGLLIRSAPASLCPKCRMTFPTHREFEVHMSECHNIALESPAVQQIVSLAVDEYITCPLCQGRVLQKELEHHISLHVVPAAAPLPHACPMCESRFSHLTDLDEHKRQKHKPAHYRSGSPARSHTRHRSRSPRHSRRSDSRRRRSRSRSRSPRRDRSQRSPSRQSRDRSPSRRSRDRSPARSHSNRTRRHRQRSPSGSGERSPHSHRHRRRSRSPADRTPVAQHCPLCPSSHCTLMSLLLHLADHHHDDVHAARLPVEQLLNTLRNSSNEKRRESQRDVEMQIRVRFPDFQSKGKKRSHSPETGSGRSRRRDDDKAQPCPRSRHRSRSEDSQSDQRHMPRVSYKAEPGISTAASSDLIHTEDERPDYRHVDSEHFLRIGVMLGIPMGQEFDANDCLIHENEVEGKAAKSSGTYSNQASALPQVPGDCEICGERMFDLITHCSGFHNSKISFDIAVQDFLVTDHFF